MLNWDERLTTRQNEVLEIMAEGVSQQDCAQRLGIAKDTVDSHLGAAYKALGVSNIVGALVESGYLRRAA